jgi:hypothetical protein
MKKLITAAIALAIAPAALQSAAFTPNNLLVYRVGDGIATLANTGNAVFIDEYSITAQGVATLVQSVPLPTTASTTTPVQRQCVASGTATSEGQLARSSDGASVTASCYGSDIPAASALNTSLGTVVPRVIAQIKADGTVDTTTALSDYNSGNNPRSVVSDGTGFWAIGGAGGVRYATLGASTSTDVSTAITNIRYIDIVGGNLYISHASAVASSRIAQIGTGLPTTSGQLANNLSGFPTTAGLSSYQFAFLDVDATVAGIDTAYVADDGAAVEAIQKWNLVDGVWTLRGTINTFADAIVRADPRSVVARFLPGQGVAIASVFAGNTIAVTIDNTGYNIAPTGVVLLPVVTASANRAFRGLSPTPNAPAGRDFKDGFEDLVPPPAPARILW